jgi:hypothetical protein
METIKKEKLIEFPSLPLAAEFYREFGFSQRKIRLEWNRAHELKIGNISINVSEIKNMSDANQKKAFELILKNLNVPKNAIERIVIAFFEWKPIKEKPLKPIVDDVVDVKI